MRDKKSLNRNEDAVSEVVDFSITLGVMLLAIAVIALAGYPMVQHMKENGHMENIKQSFSVLTPNVNKIVFGKAPSQSVELKLYGGTIYVTGSSYMNISMEQWNESTSSLETVSYERQLRMIENQYIDTSVAYENTGAWVKYPQGRALMISKPVFAYDNNSLIIPMVTITGSKGTSGSGLIRVISDGGQLAVETYNNVSKVEITMSSEYYEGWNTYFQESLEMANTSVNTTTRTIYAEKSYNPNIDVFIMVSPMSVTVE
ncbi:MAG: hypothetical protein PWQ75_884 [Methanolobus sp.]|uniref:Archaeal flagellin-like protein n=1 Tax=Methanolobus tindarius DSM 2278 TaxID=1090322 RepID=W9DXY3_METTI|nr:MULTISPECIES: hypothetical protein [Methanolobus]ETA68281.1 hypothetical protein MettiDRAFT_1739 [Methanolobus tindarius DSM 2278]MDI3486047.1 hypothetical protein [Methanolobus sp.]MDK2831132.1 hypothetical protein [Methanolobus sp.]